MKAAFAKTGKKPRNCKYRRFLPKLMIHDYEALMKYGLTIRSVINVDTIPARADCQDACGRGVSPQ